VPILIALLFALVIAAFFVSRRAGTAMLAGVAVVVALMFAWTWYTEDGSVSKRNAIPVEQVEILETRRRGNTTDHLLRNNSQEWTLVALHTEQVAQLADGTVIDRRKFVHRMKIPPQQARWETLRFFGLQIGLEYDMRITGTEGLRDAGR
jgi:uncharacterized membrane protein